MDRYFISSIYENDKLCKTRYIEYTSTKYIVYTKKINTLSQFKSITCNNTNFKDLNSILEKYPQENGSKSKNIDKIIVIGKYLDNNSFLVANYLGKLKILTEKEIKTQIKTIINAFIRNDSIVINTTYQTFEQSPNNNTKEEQTNAKTKKAQKIGNIQNIKKYYGSNEKKQLSVGNIVDNIINWRNTLNDKVKSNEITVQEYDLYKQELDKIITDYNNIENYKDIVLWYIQGKPKIQEKNYITQELISNNYKNSNVWRKINC